jgi:subtilisin family serine protease
VVAGVLVAALGFAGAAAITAFTGPGYRVVSSFGPHGDGRTRLVVTVPGGVTPVQLAALQRAAGVDSAQRIFTGEALVAGFGITPGELQAAVPGAAVAPSVTGSVAGNPVTDPAWTYDGYNLSNNGSNADPRTQTRPVAGADVDAPAGWAASTGRGEVVAVLDTGMTNQPDLAGALWTNPDEPCGSTDTDADGYAGDCHGWNFYGGNADITNSGGDASHGTAVAGTVAARAGNGEGLAGVAPDATIMPLVVGSGEDVDIYAAAQAIVYAADHGATVINGSWGGNGGASLLQSAIDYANSKGVLVVVAAANDHGDRDTTPIYPASLHAPNLVVVGATTPSDTMTSFSGYGAHTVDLFAPGDLVFVPWWQGGYALMSGTSFSSPETAAAAALYRSVYPGDTPAQTKARMLNDVTVVPALQGRSVTGGRLSLTALGNTAAGVTYTFSGMTSVPGTVNPTVVVNGSAPAGTYSVQLGLGMEDGGQTWALADQAITVGDQTLSTGDDGTATFDLGALPALASQVVRPSTTLAEGRYVLTAQVLLDGAPVGRAYAAPLLVSTTPPATSPGTTTPGTPVPGTSPGTSPGASDPSAGSTPGTSQPGAGNPSPGTQPGSGSTPGAGNPSSGSQPGSGTQPGTSPGTSDPWTGTQPGPVGMPGTSDPSAGPNPGTSPGTSDPSSGTQPGSGTSPGTSDPWTGTQPGPVGMPGTSDPSSGTQPGTSTPPDLGGSSTYPGTGTFGVTSVSPTRVATSGGTAVTVTGTAIPAGVRVRIGATTAATVVSASGTQVVFTAPALVAGTYDLYLFAPDGTSAVLTGGLTYVDTSGSGSPGAGGTTPGTTTPGTTTPGTTTPGTTTPGTTTPGTTTPGTAPGGTTPGTSTPGVPADGTPRVGPNGEHLRYSARLVALGSGIWGVNCASTCSGLAM